MIRSGECTFESLLSDVARRTFVLRSNNTSSSSDECVLRSMFEECERLKDESNALLVAGALEIARLRENVTLRTGYTISAGIARNKLLAKLVSGKHKPDKQTLLPNHEVIQLLDQLALQELNGFGGKLGDHLVSKHNIEHVGDLRKYSVTELMEMVRDVRNLYHSEKLTQTLRTQVPSGGSFSAKENTAKWIYNATRGICHEVVESRLRSKSIGCSKTFRGPCILRTMSAIQDYIEKLGLEIAQRTRLAFRNHGMIPTMLGIGWHFGLSEVRRKGDVVKITGDGGSKSTTFPSSMLSNLNEEEEKLAREVSTRAMSLFRRVFSQVKSGWGVTCLSLSAFKFNSLVSPKSRIDRFLKSDAASPSRGDGAEKKSFKRRRVNKSDIDPSVLAQLPRSIREEILAAATDGEKKKKKNTVSRKRKSKPRTIESMMMKSLNSNAASKAPTVTTTTTTTSTTTNSTKSLESLNRAELDVDVLMALPENIRAEVLESLHNNNNNKKSPTKVVKKKRKRTKLDSWLKN